MKPRIRVGSKDYDSWVGGWTLRAKPTNGEPFFLFSYNPNDDYFTRMMKLEIARDRFENKYRI